MDDQIEHINGKSILPALVVSIFLIAVVYIVYLFTQPRTGAIVLPGGVTYLGPSPTPVQTSATIAPKTPGGAIPIPSNAAWTTNTGKKFPYSFQYPTTVSLGVFPNDPYDGVTIFYANTDPQGNLFFRVEDLNKLDKKQYIGNPLEYAKTWWKDYSWKGLDSVTAFNNAQGLKGYRAKYIDETGKTPYDHVFFEVPNRKDLMIWMSGKLFHQHTFDRMVDTVAWK